MKMRLIATIGLLLLVIVFMVQNAAIVEIKLMVWDVAMPRSLLVLMMLLIGVVIGWFARAMYRISRTTETKGE